MSRIYDRMDADSVYRAAIRLALRDLRCPTWAVEGVVEYCMEHNEIDQPLMTALALAWAGERIGLQAW